MRPWFMVAAVAFVVLAAATREAAIAGVTEMVSVDSLGGHADHSSLVPTMSRDGKRIAFWSLASNLVSDDTNGYPDVFVHDRETGATRRVNVDSNGLQANDFSAPFVAISGDGRCVAFASFANNLVPDDTNGTLDVFVHDLVTGVTERVSVDSGGLEVAPPNDCRGLAISNDGRYVTFDSPADNLVRDDTNQAIDVFVHDRQSHLTARVSVDSLGVQGDGDSFHPTISSAGRFVAFASQAGNLVADDTTSAIDVFVHDLETGQTERVSVSSTGEQANHSSDVGSLSADGRFVSMVSTASNLVSGDVNQHDDAFVHDRVTGETRLVSVDVNGRQFSLGTPAYPAPVISADGRFVAFVADPRFLSRCAYVHEISTGLTSMVSVNSSGAKADRSSWEVVLSGNGDWCAISSDATNFVTGDGNGATDVFVHARTALTFDGIPRNPNPVHFTVSRGEASDLALVLLSCSGTQGGFLFGARYVPLTFDACTLIGLQAYPFLTAVVDGNGTAITPSLTFPPADAGQSFFASALTIDPQTGFIESVTSPIAITTQ